MTRRAPGTALLLAASFLGGVALSLEASGKSRMLRFKAGNARVRAIVPEIFEPLLPGSFYPNRRKAKAWSAGTVVIVEQRLAPRAEPYLLARGLLVAEVESIDTATVDAIAAELSRRVAGGIGAVTLLAQNPGDALSSRRLRSTALFDPSRRPAIVPSLPCPSLAFFHRAKAGELPAAAPLADGDCVIERWYRGGDGFPDEAFRDAAEWLASASRRRD